MANISIGPLYIFTPRSIFTGGPLQVSVYFVHTTTFFPYLSVYGSSALLSSPKNGKLVHKNIHIDLNLQKVINVGQSEMHCSGNGKL